MPLRANNAVSASVFDCVYAKLFAGKVYFGYLYQGVLTEFSSGVLAPIPYSQTAADRWDFQIGAADGSNNWLWRVWLNTVEITSAGGVTFDPGGAVSAALVDSDHDWPAVGMTADGQFIFVPFQVGPIEVEAIKWSVPA
jgi:hypothetical protein